MFTFPFLHYTGIVYTVLINSSSLRPHFLFYVNPLSNLFDQLYSICRPNLI
jgi:hypothetical protein